MGPVDFPEALRVENDSGKVLWLFSIRDPKPRSGAQIYSDALAAAVANHGYDVWLAGQLRAGEGARSAGDLPTLTIPYRRPTRLRQICSLKPAMVAQTRQKSARKWLEFILVDDWDAIVVSHLFSYWAVRVLLRRRRAGDRALILYSSHNHETLIWREAALSSSLEPRQRLARFIDYWRVAYCERRVVRAADGVIAICSSDAASMEQIGAKRVVVARPGLDEPIRRDWSQIADRPPLVMVLGSVEWGLKLANLNELLEAVHDRWAAVGVRLAVGGRIEDRVLASLRARFPSVEILGAIDHPEPLYGQARAAIIHEPLGGGFKMKLLSYVAHGVPVVATDRSIEFTDESVSRLAIRVDDLRSLARLVPTLIEDVDRLENQRHEAADTLESVFRWDVAARQVASLLCL